MKEFEVILTFTETLHLDCGSLTIREKWRLHLAAETRGEIERMFEKPVTVAWDNSDFMSSEIVSWERAPLSRSYYYSIDPPFDDVEITETGEI